MRDYIENDLIYLSIKSLLSLNRASAHFNFTLNSEAIETDDVS